jgi:hypothetical protein
MASIQKTLSALTTAQQKPLTRGQEDFPPTKYGMVHVFQDPQCWSQMRSLAHECGVGFNGVV